MIKQAGKYPVTEIMLHTSATPTNWSVGKTIDQVIKDIDGWHRARNFRMIGYHRVVMPDGEMGVGRSIFDTAAACKDHGKNYGVVHICMIPVYGIQKMGQFEDFYTPEQRETVQAYIQELQAYAKTEMKVTGHNQYAAKLCPGFYVNSKEWGGI